MTDSIQTEMLQKLALTRYIVASPEFSDNRADGVHRLVLSTRTGNIVRASAGLWDILVRGDLQSLEDGVIAALYNAGLLVPEGTDELAEIIAENDAAIADCPTLYEVIQPSAFCQLGCNYCGQEHDRKQLDDANRQKIVERIAEKVGRKKYRRLHIGWFGAEPLAGKASIRALTPQLRSLALSNGASYSASMVTNGVSLSVRTAREMAVEHGVSGAEITLDGPRDEHDARRYFKNGGPSFDRILENVVAIAGDTSIPLAITIRCNIDSRNSSSIESLIDTLSDSGLAGKVNLYFAPVRDWGNSASKLSLDANSYARLELDLAVYAMSHGFATPLLPARKEIVCMAVRPDSDVVDAYGNIFNCTETPYVASYGTPNRHRIGVLGGPGTDRSVNRFSDFNSDVRSGSYGCSKCPMLPVCGGSCPKSWTEGQAACPAFKHNMPDRLLVGYALSKLTGDVDTIDAKLAMEEVS